MTRHPPPAPPTAAGQAQPPASGVFPRIPVARTTDVDEARQIFRDIYADSRLEPERARPFGWALDLIRCGTVSVTMGATNGATRVVAPAVGERHVLTLSDGGTGGGEHAGQSYTVIPGRSGVILSPGLSMTLEVSAGFQGRNITIEPAALRAHLTALTGLSPRGPIVFDAAVSLETGPGAVLLGVAQLFRSEVERSGASPHMVAALRDALLTALLTGVKHSASHLLEPSHPRVAPACVRRAEEYIEAHAAEPITLASLAAATGAPARSLRATFTASRGMAPMEFVRRQRYELARRQLIEAEPGTRVVSVVKALGLGDPGRFSVEFKKRFGQSPSEVLAGGRASAGTTALKGHHATDTFTGRRVKASP